MDELEPTVGEDKLEESTGFGEESEEVEEVEEEDEEDEDDEKEASPGEETE
ncbi:MAG: hypothetical protein Q7S15_02725 [bacterium]|nr:hypothetical protein [bacterium]